jgi:arabinogalactan endo-1,4-beta-galactosidase
MAACPGHRQADRPTGSTLRNGAVRHLSRLIFVVVALLAGQAVVEARPEDDALNGAKLNRCLWDDWSNNGQVTPGGTLVLATSATTAPSFPQILSQYMLTGDFSFSVSVAVGGAWSQTVAPTDQEYAYLGFYADDSNQVFIAFGRTPGGAEVVAFSYVKEQFNVLARQPVAGTSIQLRIVRSAGTASLQYNSGASWQTLATLGNFTLDGLVKLGAATIGTARPLTASFTNFSIASGTSTYRPYVAAPVVGRADFRLGGHSADYLIQRVWGGLWSRVDPLGVLHQNGMGWLRVAVTTLSSPQLANTPVASWSSLPFQSNYWSSLEMATQILTEGAAHGMRLDLFFFLSDDSAFFNKQNAPAAWKGLSVAATVPLLQAHTAQTMQHMQAKGLNVEVVEIGNEIDLGILNFLPGDRLPLPTNGNSTITDLTYLRTQVWPTEATLLNAAAAGIRSVKPDAKIVLHIAGTDISPADIFAKAFFQSMIANGVDFDIAALSLPYALYPWRLDSLGANCWFQRLQETTDYIAALGKPVQISETQYPYDPTNQVAAPVPGFPFTQQGQAGWIASILQLVNNDPNFATFMYFYPDENLQYSSPADTWQGSLFTASENPVAGLAAFQSTAASLASPLVAAVLPASRSEQVGGTVTAFATMINAGTSTLNGCSIAPAGGLPSSFLYQTTDPATNALIGSANAPVNIAAGAAQSFVIAFTPTIPIAPNNVMFEFACSNTAPAAGVVGLNTLLLSASATPVADIVALAASGDPGIVDIPGPTGSGAFAVATVNLGASASITASADTGSAALPVTLFLCQTNPQTGACISTIGPSVTTTINPHDTPTFAIFVKGSGTVPFAPASNRVFVRFKDAGVTRGATSVAVRTQ